MRQKRAKTYKRVMALYTQAFGFRQPFQLLVSTDLLASTSAQVMDVRKGLATCVQGEIKPMITQCCIEALYALGKPGQSAVDTAKTFERRRCNHRKAIAPDECLKEVIGTTNKHRYVLASQSPSLRTSLASIPGLPIVHYNPRGVLVLSPPGVATVREKNKLEEERRMEGARVLEGIVDGGNVVGMSDAATTGNPGSGGTAGGAGPSKRNRPKAPNPLSVKKKKASSGGNAGQATGGGGETGKKRRRDSDDGGAEGEAIDAGGETVEGETDTAAEVGKRKKKRRRRGKGAVAAAIAEIRERGGVGSGSEENANEDSE